MTAVAPVAQMSDGLDVAGMVHQAAVCPAEELAQVAAAGLAAMVARLPAVAATVVLVSPGAPPKARSWAASGSAGAGVDAAQARAGQGPVFLAAEQDEIVVCSDLVTDVRWRLPALEPVASGRSVVAAALPGSARGRAVLTVHGTGSDLVDPAVVEQIVALVPGLATVVAVVQARMEVEHLNKALASNRVIGAAIGVAMASQRLTYKAAGELLHVLSHETNVRLADLAENILFTGELPVIAKRGPRGRRPVPPG